MKKMYLMGVLALAALGTSPLTAQTAPPNDDICNAIPLQMNSTSAGDAYINVGATAQSGEPTPDCWNSVANESVWFSFVAPALGEVFINTFQSEDSDFFVTLGLYSTPNGYDCASSSSFSSLIPISCMNPDGEPYPSSLVVNSLIPGKTYYLQIDSPFSPLENFGIQLLDLPTVGASNCSVNQTSSVDGTTNTPGGRIQLTWQAPANAVNGLTQYNIYTFADIQGTSPQLIKKVTYGTSTHLIASAETVFWNAVPTNGTFEASGCAISSFTVAAAPLGHVAQSAIPITASQLPYTSPLDNTNNYGNDYDSTDKPNVDANTQVQTGDFDSINMSGNDVVYAFTPDQSGAYDVGLTELKTGNNYVDLILFEGVRFHTVLGYHSAGNGTTRSLSGLQLVAGTTYYVVVSANTSSTDQPYKLSVKKTAKLALPAKAYLQAALLNSTDGTMGTTLWDNGTLPLTSPYADALALDANVTNLPANKVPVDWIWTELRDANDPKIVKEGRSALLLKDGSIVDPQNVASPMVFTRTAGNYHLVLKHRNHLGIMTGSTVALSSNTALVDFTNSNSPITYGTHAQAILNGSTCALWAGNANGVKQVKFQGSGNDTTSIKDRVLSEAGNTSSSNLYSFTGMSTADVNLDGQIKYQGSGNDSTLLKDIVLSHPGNTGSSNLFTIEEQLPEHNN
jgi:hypothetical protein